MLGVKTLTIRLPDALAAEIEHESRERRVSKSDVVRERLRRPGSGASYPGKTGELLADILRESWAAKIPAGPPRFKSAEKQKLAELIRAKKLRY